MASLLCLLAACCSILLQPAVGIPLSSFYPFGATTGDTEFPSNDDGSAGPIALSIPFPFFASLHTTLHVNNNGDITFDGPLGSFTSSPFPLSNNRQMIAPYWADVDTRRGGRVWYREASSDAALLMRARNEIRTSLVSQMNFQPTFLFIATWESVAYFIRGGSSNLRNTFQCIMVSDGRRSFVKFFYADGLIQWTTGDASGGSGGLGGTEAQVGFNAGDGVRFASVPGSQTPDIINIDTTSNVGRPGVWLFRVDEEEIVINECDRESAAPLQIAPRLGSMLGGTAILIAGPCFSPEDDIICTFGTAQVTGSYISEVMVLCVSPYLERRGWTDLTVTLWAGMEMRYTGQSRFYAISFEDTSDVTFSGSSASSLHFAGLSRADITWSRDSLIPMMDPDSLRVNIGLVEMNLVTGRWERTEMLATNQANDGQEEVTFPLPQRPVNSENNTRPIAIEVTVASAPEFSAAEAVVNTVKSWSSVAFFTTSSFALQGACEFWRRQQQSGIGQEILSRLPPCPRRLDQARAPNSGFKEDAGLARFLSRNFFHRGASACFRQTTFDDTNMRSGQQCCYYPDGTLATNSRAGGTVDLVSPEISTLDHFRMDVLPSIACCFGLFSNCDYYYEHRPSDNGSRYNPPPPACVYGDPHIVTLDGFKYTFNGLGEYTLIETPRDRFTLQGRMQLPTGETLEPGIRATVFTAIVAREDVSDTVQIQLTQDGQSLEMLMNGELVDFSDLADQEFNNVAVSDRGNDTLSATFSSGVYIEARESNGFISTLLVSLSRTYQGRTAGLMGNYDGDTSDDLIPLGGTVGVPLNSSLEDIHFRFGVTWIISREEDSLFTYRPGMSFGLFNIPRFIPTFSPPFASPELEAQAIAMCGGDSFCLFDVAATGSMDIGLSTLQGGVEFETIVDISVPVFCFPPCENGACVTNDTCSCSTGFEGARCTEPIFTECDVNPCENGGRCRMRAGSYICSCPFGFSGINCQTEEQLSDFGSGMFGSGGNLFEDCECRREVECSIAASYNAERTAVTSNGPNLQCVIDLFESDGDGRDLLAVDMGSGSGFGVSPITIDDSFNFNYLSVGSFSFLRSIGVISRDDGVSSCSLQDSQQMQDSLLEALGMERISLIFRREDGQFDSVSLDMNFVTQVLQREDFTIGGQLDETQACSFRYLLDDLSRQPSRTSYTCRNPQESDLDTILTFRVYCG